MSWFKLIGNYPKEYNAAVHGPYDPARYYGKPDTPFSQVKLGELPGWLARREKSPRAIAAAVSRAFWAWQHKYHLPRKAGMAGHFQFIVATMTFFYIINYARIQRHRNYKYHW